MDKIFWKPGWIESDRAEFRSAMIKIMEQPEWVIDGNFDGSLSLRLEYCDTVIMLDYNRLTCFMGYFNRYLKFKGKSRPSMTEGCEEKLDWSYLKWLWKFPKDRDKMVDKIKATDKKVLVFRNRKETAKFIAGLK